MDKSSLFAAGIACLAAGLAPILAALYGLMVGAASLGFFAALFFVVGARKTEAA